MTRTMMIKAGGNHSTEVKIVIVLVIAIVTEVGMVGMTTIGGERGTMIETRIDGGVGEMTTTTGRVVAVGGGRATREVRVAVGEGERMRGARAVDMRRIGGLVGGRGTLMKTTTMMSTITRTGNGGVVVGGRIGMREGWGGHRLGDEVD